MSFALILPFLRPIEKLILDDDITEIMMNPSGRIFVEQQGEVLEVPDVRLDPRHLAVAVRNIARLLGDDISETKPILDARLPDGSRIAALLPPCSVGGTAVTIRKFGRRLFSVGDLVGAGSLDEATAQLLVAAVRGKKNLLISGGTGAGKTTLLGALLDAVPDEERIILIEDIAEVRLAKPNLVRFEARRSQGELPEVSIRDLLKASLRHRPDRIVVGEVRGGEAFDLLQALNTGHAGTLSTLHANSGGQALTRLAHCVLQAAMDLPYADILGQIGTVLDVVVQIARRQGRRLVTEVAAVNGFNQEDNTFELETLFRASASPGGTEADGPGSLPPRRCPGSAVEPRTVKKIERSA